jgi:hypothetical protein
MTTLLIVLAIVYVVGMLVAAGWNLLEWSTARSWARDDRFARDRPRHEAEARQAARGFVQSPLWPLMALGALIRIYADSKENP